VNADDDNLFRSAVRGTRPLRQDRIEPARRRRAPLPLQALRDDTDVRRSMLEFNPVSVELASGEELLYTRAGVQRSTLRRLRRGHYAVQAELDLHGHTVVEAGARLAEFLQHARLRGWRCVRIIHGKGHGSRHKRPVLKGQLNYWLPRRDQVLAFCSARPADGGSGALYVLLKN
jgi:DNA-nicking Smr family endonuclease